jgi:hypothetical protein
MMQPQLCPICGEPARAELTTSMSFPFTCPRCGEFVITFELLKGSIPDNLRPYISAATRQATEEGRQLKITTTNFREIADYKQRTTVSEKLNKSLAYIAKKTGAPGSWHPLRLAYDYPLVDARDEDELKAYLDYLVRQGLLFEEQATGAGNAAAYQLTIEGWRQMEPVIRPGGEPGRCFVASSLDDQMDEPYMKGIEPAVKACGYSPVWMKNIPENEGITDRILSEIRRAEFIVADFTGQRQSVYFEAGFARGLGREVIQSCREDDVKHLHFDTRHLGHVLWKEPADLRQKLEDSIRANIVKPA